MDMQLKLYNVYASAQGYSSIKVTVFNEGRRFQVYRPWSLSIGSCLGYRFDPRTLYRRLNGRYIFDPPDHVCVDHGFETLFWPLSGHAPGVAVSISERRPGVSRWREGVGFGVGHVYS
jgi:hypothetical protein